MPLLAEAELAQVLLGHAPAAQAARGGQAWGVALSACLIALRGSGRVPLPRCSLRARGCESRIKLPPRAIVSVFMRSRRSLVAPIVTAGGRVVGRGGPGEDFGRPALPALTVRARAGRSTWICFIAAIMAHAGAALSRVGVR